MTGSRQRQKGMGEFSWLATIMAVGVIGMFLMKVIPLYYEDHVIARVLTSLDGKPGVDKASASEVREWFRKGLMVSAVTLDKGEARVLRDAGGRVSIEIGYERRVNFLYNIDLVLTFEHDWKVKSQ